MSVAICRTEGCENYLMAIEVPDNGFETYCGVCGQLIKVTGRK